MKWEPRKKLAANAEKSPQSDLPVDYLKVVAETLEQALSAGLVEMRKIYPTCEFHANGAIFPEEVIMAVTLSHGEKNIVATTVYASADFKPLAPKVGIEGTLAACVDAIGSVYDFYLNPNEIEKIEQLSHTSLSALDEAPFDWSSLTIQTQTTPISVWVKMDKTNPHLEALADQWLNQHDPHVKSAHDDKIHAIDAEEFLEQRLEAIKKVRSGGGGPNFGGGGGGFSGNQNGPITH